MNKISIIVPSFNYGHFISETLDSVLSQTYLDWECIVVDDGSTDNTKDVVASYVARDERFKYIYQNNRGLAATRNRGLQEARGDFIQFLDADDLLESRKLELQSKYLQEHPDVDIVYGDCRFFATERPSERLFSMWGDNEPWMPKISGKGNEILRYLLKMNIMVVSSPLVRRKFIDVCGIFDETMKANEDWDLWIRCALRDFNFAYLELPDTCALIRYHAVSMSRNLLVQYSSCLDMLEKIKPKLTDKEIKKLFKTELSRFRTEYNQTRLSYAMEEMKNNPSISSFFRLAGFSILNLNARYLLHGINLFLRSSKTAKKLSGYRHQ